MFWVSDHVNCICCSFIVRKRISGACALSVKWTVFLANVFFLLFSLTFFIYSTRCVARCVAIQFRDCVKKLTTNNSVSACHVQTTLPMKRRLNCILEIRQQKNNFKILNKQPPPKTCHLGALRGPRISNISEAVQTVAHWTGYSRLLWSNMAVSLRIQ